MNSEKLVSIYTRYKGSYVRIYLQRGGLVEGLLVGYWDGCFVTLICDKGYLSDLVSTRQDDISCVVGIPSFSMRVNGNVNRLVYSNLN